MRTFKLDLKKIDKKYLIGVIITFLCAIICGIVLCKNVISNVYFKNFSTKYIYITCLILKRERLCLPIFSVRSYLATYFCCFLIILN